MRRLGKNEALARVESEASASCKMCEHAGSLDPIAQSAHAIAVLDRFASREGHVVVIARRHEEHVAKLAWDEYADMQRMAWDVTRALDDAFSPRRVFVAALGSAANRLTSFPHVHIHVVPLRDGGEDDRPANVFTWEQGIFVFESDAEEAAMRETIRRALHRTRA